MSFETDRIQQQGKDGINEDGLNNEGREMVRYQQENDRLVPEN